MSWTQQNINLLIDNVSKNPTNLGHAFQLTSNVIGKSKDTISKYYYNNIKNKQAVISMATKNGFTVNTKNTRIVKDVESEMRLDIMKSILTKMTIDQRKEVVKIILQL